MKNHCKYLFNVICAVIEISDLVTIVHTYRTSGTSYVSVKNLIIWP